MSNIAGELNMEGEKADLGEAEDNLLWRPQNIQVLKDLVVVNENVNMRKITREDSSHDFYW